MRDFERLPPTEKEIEQGWQQPYLQIPQTQTDLDSFIVSTSNAPVREFRGWLKSMRPDFQNKLGELVFSTSFPLFDSEYGEIDEPDFSHIPESEVHVPSGGAVRFRRYAGDTKGHLSLDRGRYYSVCQDASGYDAGTLASELNAYCVPSDVGFAFVVDETTPEAPDKCIYIFLASAYGIQSEAINQAVKQKLFPADARYLMVDIPYLVEEHTIPNVLDLRYPDAQQWLFDTFAAGNWPWLIYDGTPLDDGFFFDLLPSLMIRDNGGDLITNAIGNYLRRIGIAGLIYPSARADVYVDFIDGELQRFGGWTFVDYRNQSNDPPCEATVVPSDWPLVFRDIWNKPPSDPLNADPNTMVRIASGPPYEGSWQVEGNENHHCLLFHWIFGRRVWDENGADTWVRGYRWHETRWGEGGVGKKPPLARCVECTSVLRVNYYDIPAACPACGSNARHIHMP